MTKSKIIIDENICIGCNTCALMAPETYKLDDETYKAKVIKQPETITDEVKTVVESCPVNAISIVEEQ